MYINELKEFWDKATTEERIHFVVAMDIRTHKWNDNSYSPRHPLFGTPSRETFATETQAAVSQVDWIIKHFTS